jgi:hypothetical protein
LLLPWGDKIFVGTLDGRLIALQEVTGKKSEAIFSPDYVARRPR